MATPAQLEQDALNIVSDWGNRITQGAVMNDLSPQGRAFFVDLCTAVQMLAQAALSASPSSVTLDPADTTNVSTTTPAAEGSV